MTIGNFLKIFHDFIRNRQIFIIIRKLVINPRNVQILAKKVSDKLLHFQLLVYKLFIIIMANDARLHSKLFDNR